MKTECTCGDPECGFDAEVAVEAARMIEVLMEGFCAQGHGAEALAGLLNSIASHCIVNASSVSEAHDKLEEVCDELWRQMDEITARLAESRGVHTGAVH